MGMLRIPEICCTPNGVQRKNHVVGIQYVPDLKNAHPPDAGASYPRMIGNRGGLSYGSY
jgi:hypothetical protein